LRSDTASGFEHQAVRRIVGIVVEKGTQRLGLIFQALNLGIGISVDISMGVHGFFTSCVAAEGRPLADSSGRGIRELLNSRGRKSSPMAVSMAFIRTVQFHGESSRKLTFIDFLRGLLLVRRALCGFRQNVGKGIRPVEYLQSA
jgi:hypothetical protein